MSAFLLLAALAGCAKPAPVPATRQTINGINVQMTTDPSPPHTGITTLILMLTDQATGAPIGNANISATAAMLAPRLPGPSVSGRSQGNGRYEVPMNLGIATRYEVDVQITRTGQMPFTVSFPLNAEH